MVPHCSDAVHLKPSMDDEMRLYDLASDPLETTDAALQEAAVLDRLKRLVVSKGLSCMCFQCGLSGAAAGTLVV